MDIRFPSAVIACFIVSTPSTSFAQDFDINSYSADDVPKIETLVPLTEYMARLDDSIIPSYVFFRCSGLFLGLKYYTGATFSDEFSLQNENGINVLQALGTMTKLNDDAARRGVSIDNLSDNYVAESTAEHWLEINGYAFFYDDRMNANYRQDGEAIAQDPLLVGDFQQCNATLGQWYEILENSN